MPYGCAGSNPAFGTIFYINKLKLYSVQAGEIFAGFINSAKIISLLVDLRFILKLV